MKCIILAALLAAFGIGGGVAPAYAQQVTGNQPTISIIPQPARLVPGSGRFAIGPDTRIYVGSRNDELRRIGQSLSQDIERATGVAVPVVLAAPGPQNTSVISVVLAPATDTLGAEGYTLRVQPSRVVLTASQPAGAYWGTQTIKQLLPIQRGAAASLPVVDVVDKPRYSWRGMHLDVCRHFFPVEFVKQYIDYLALHKLNTFHWHLTDDQGWRIEIKKYPKLTSVGGWREGTLIGHYGEAVPRYDHQRYGGFYTQEQVKEVVAYAQARYITVVPEIEMPGHAVAALTAYPELSCTGGPFKVEQTWGVFDDIFCAGNEQTFQFLQDVLAEVATLFPGKIIHIGGDEAPKTRWHTCPKCQARMRAEHLKDEHELQSYFVQRMEKFLNTKGKTIIGWDEILEGGLAPGAAVMSWRGMEGGVAAARQQHQVVMTPGEYAYFDHYQGDPALEPLAFGGYLPLEKVYAFDPTPKELTAAERPYILGAQANLWTEYIPTTQQVEYMVLPRMAALAEVLWTPPARKSWPDFQQRMRPQYQRYAALGANYARSAFNVQQRLVADTTELGDMVSLNMQAAGPQIHYTLDGLVPTSASPLYTQPFALTNSALVQAASFENGQITGKVTAKQVTAHKAFAVPVRLAHAPRKSYAGPSGPLTLVDGLHGSLDHHDGQWLGWQGDDLIATLDLRKPTSISTVKSAFLQQTDAKILLPTSLEVAISKDGRTYKTVYATPVAPSAQSAATISEVKADFKKTKARFVRVTARNAQATLAAASIQEPQIWLFADELVVE
ncbi:MAG: glycoside hydrolase family 20 protein [Janthinobacterium lividum]